MKVYIGPYSRFTIRSLIFNTLLFPFEDFAPKSYQNFIMKVADSCFITKLDEFLFPLKPRHKIRIDDWDIYSLDYTLSFVILPALIKFKDNLTGHPSEITFEEWQEILGKMITAFRLISEDRDDEFGELELEIKEGLSLFAQYYRHLWD